jgi:hypothetical protein
MRGKKRLDTHIYARCCIICRFIRLPRRPIRETNQLLRTLHAHQDGKTALEWADLKGHSEVVKLLRLQQT